MDCSLQTLLYVALLSTLPGFEGRYAILVAAYCPAAPIVAYVSSTTMGILVYMLLDRLVALLERLSPRLHRVYVSVEERIARRLGESGGLAALVVFVAIPLPGSGVWSGAIAAKLLGLKRSHAILGLVAGNMLAVALTSILKTIGVSLLDV